jgi:hypothetical protein
MRQSPEEFQNNGSSIWIIPSDPSVAQFVKVVLAGAGFNVDGDNVQRQKLAFETLSFNWNCYFPNSGIHEFSLHAHATVEEGVRKVGSLKKTIRVVKIWFLTKRQIWIIEQVAVIVSAAIAIVATFHKLGLC